jgi:hypothetical protein
MNFFSRQYPKSPSASPCASRWRNTLSDLRGARTAQGKPDESGVTLILALIFVLAIGLVLVALVYATGGALLNSSNLKNQRAVEYAADGATTMAAQTVRYSGNPYCSITGTCPGLTGTTQTCLPPTVGFVTLNGIQMKVYCSGQLWNSISGVTRVVNFFACQSGTCSSTNSVLQAQITFDDYPLTGSKNCLFGQSPPQVSTCGTGMTINSWVLKTANN